MKKIIIDKDLKFMFEDLMCDVDLSHEFTLGDVLLSVVNSPISIQILQKILRCNGLEDYYKESLKKPFKKGNIDYLELSLAVRQERVGCEVSGAKEWVFCGLGKEGVVSPDIKKYVSVKEQPTYREHYAVEFEPMWNLAGLKIKINDKISIGQPNFDTKEYKAIVPITLLELLYGIFYELSWFGDIMQRDEMTKELGKRIKKVKDGVAGKCVLIDKLKKKFCKEK